MYNRRAWFPRFIKEWLIGEIEENQYRTREARDNGSNLHET